MYQNIPLELRERPQWVVWRYVRSEAAKPTKLPINPHTGTAASSTDPSNWGTFDACVNLAANPLLNLNGIGFVLTEADPYCFIDLDDTAGDEMEIERQHKIFTVMNSYAEVSPSGRGLHIFVKAQVLAGRKRSNVEIYSSARYVCMTGNVFHNAPIADRQPYIDILWSELGKNYEAYNSVGFVEQTESDREIYDKAVASRNGQKFLQLWNGDWQNVINEKTGRPYPSQSEADLALINMLVFWTQSENQIRNMFLLSALGARKKGHRIDYVNRMIRLAFDQTVPMIDFEKVNQQLKETIEAGKNAARAQPGSSDSKPGTRAIAAVQAANGSVYHGSPVVNALELPPGLIGELSQFIYAAAPRPVPEAALLASLGLMSGICGRSYNISGTGLNLYLLLIAKTGVGKDSMKSGIEKLIAALKPMIPSIDTFMGPASIQSGQALIRRLSTTPSFVSIIGEFDKFLAAMSHKNANYALIELRKNLLDLYNRSSAGAQFSGTIYSDTQKNIKPIDQPAFSILGEGTPERFYEMLDESVVSEGLLPRFSVIEYYGDRPDYNEIHTQVKPDIDLVKKLATVVETSLILQRGIDGKQHVQSITMEQDAYKLAKEFNKFADQNIRAAKFDVKRQLWNRAHLKMLRISGLVAVGCNVAQPVVTYPIANWSMKFVDKEINNMITHFDKGEVGDIEIKQMSAMRRILFELIHVPEVRTPGYRVDERMASVNIAQYAYMIKRLSAMAAFRQDRIGAASAINRCIQTMVDNGELREIHPNQMEQQFGSRQRAYMIVKLYE